MDGFREPVGAQPASVYWRRRFAVVIVIVALGALLWAVFSALGSDGGAGAEPEPTVSTSPSPSVTPDLARACTGADVELVAEPTKAQFASGTAATFKVTATVVGDLPCTLDPTSGESSLAITSGDDAIFSSTACDSPMVLGDKALLLQAGDVKDFEVSWNGGRDTAGCAAETAEAKPGYYWATVTVAGIPAEKVQFVIS